MLLKFGLRNFKAFRDQSFDLAPITVFVGRNGAGKSSVLQALAFLKQSSLAGEATYAARDGAPAPATFIVDSDSLVALHVGSSIGDRPSAASLLYTLRQYNAGE